MNERRGRDTPYHGVLYAGLMMSPAGPRCSSTLPVRRPRDPGGGPALGRTCSTCSSPRRDRAGSPAPGSSGRRMAVTLVLASRGYPASSSKGDEISGLRSIDSLEWRCSTRDGQGGRQDGDRGGRWSTGPASARSRRGAQEGVCGRGADSVRRHADAHRHRLRAVERWGPALDRADTGEITPVTQTEVGNQFDELDVDPPLVGIVKGSKSDMPVMEKAADELEERGIRHGSG